MDIQELANLTTRDSDLENFERLFSKLKEMKGNVPGRDGLSCIAPLVTPSHESQGGRWEDCTNSCSPIGGFLSVADLFINLSFILTVLLKEVGAAQLAAVTLGLSTLN